MSEDGGSAAEFGVGCDEKMTPRAQSALEIIVGRSAGPDAGQPAVETDDGTITTYAELVARVQPLARWFRQLLDRHSPQGAVVQDCMGSAPAVACFVDSG